MIFNKYVLTLALIIAASHGLANGSSGFDRNGRVDGNQYRRDTQEQTAEMAAANRVHANLLAVLAGGASGCIVAQVFNKMKLLPKCKENPLIATAIGVGIIAVARKYRKDVVGDLGAPAQALSSFVALGSFLLTLNYDSKEGVSADINTPVGSKHYRYQ